MLRDLAPLLIHLAFCVLLALALGYALDSGAVIVLALFPLPFLTIVLPALLYGWPPPRAFLFQAIDGVPALRLTLVVAGAMLIGCSVLSVLSFGSALSGAGVDAALFIIGAALLYGAHRCSPRRPDPQKHNERK